jgi:predicted RNase H-like HicB family nuclease/predicted RNA binding protein YcfA (HicA-like mRNA interferase family)
MPTLDKIYMAVMCGTKDGNLRFAELQKLLSSLGFQVRIKGDHFIYYKNGVDEIINIQPPRQQRQTLPGKASQKYNTEIQTGGVNMHKYERIIFWSEEDGRWLVDVPELSGCMADGSTPYEALQNAEQVISEWIETAKALGRPIPEPKGRLLYA